MATRAENSFTSWNLTDTELVEGSKLTDLQRLVLQNELTLCAEQRLGLQCNPSNPGEFFQQEAYLQGQQSIINLLLSRSDEAYNAMNQQSQE